jgi:hypothetical protein
MAEDDTDHTLRRALCHFNIVFDTFQSHLRDDDKALRFLESIANGSDHFIATFAKTQPETVRSLAVVLSAVGNASRVSAALEAVEEMEADVGVTPGVVANVDLRDLAEKFPSVMLKVGGEELPLSDARVMIIKTPPWMCLNCKQKTVTLFRVLPLREGQKTPVFEGTCDKCGEKVYS